ncbi:MAG: hypothetical protein AAFW76_07105 [Pseudomonadota bacterium]
MVAFVDLTQALASNCRRPLKLNTVSKKSLTNDEATIVCCLECLHRGDKPRTRMMVEWLVIPQAQGQVINALASFASLAREHMWAPAAPDHAPASNDHEADTDRDPAIAGRDQLSSLALSDLLDFERLIVTSARLWVDEFKARGQAGRKGPFARINEFLDANGLPGSAHSLNGILYNISVAASRPVAILCPNCEGVSKDELLLLSAISCHQQQQVDIAQMMLSAFLPPAAATLTLGAVGGLAHMLMEGDRALPVRVFHAAESGREPATLYVH